MKKSKSGPKILLIDIETAPILSYVWGLFDQTVGLSQIKSDWHILSWSEKWLGDSPSKIIYKDQRNAKNVEDDSEMLKGIWNLLDEADVVVGQNVKKFDIKKLNARFVLNGFKPPSSFKIIDTYQIAKAKFGFTSNKLEYMTELLCKKYKKSKNSGFSLWTGCLAGDLKSWREMEYYNKMDVLSLEELYIKIRPWDSSFNPNLYTDNIELTCNCGSTKYAKNGFAYTSVGKFQRHSCSSCGAEVKSRENLFSLEKRKSLKVKV